MNEGSGTTAGDSAGSPASDGTLTNGPTWIAGLYLGAGALQFDGSNDFVTFGQATSELGASSFTLETWFKRTGNGANVSTGNFGLDGTTLPLAVPLLTKGRGEEDGSNKDMNWFLGITNPTDGTNGNRLAVDFEDRNSTTGATGDGSGLNHPFMGTAVISANVWHHAAATYDSSTGIWRLYLDGGPRPDEHADARGCRRNPIALPQNGSIQHAALGSALHLDRCRRPVSSPGRSTRRGSGPRFARSRRSTPP